MSFFSRKKKLSEPVIDKPTFSEVIEAGEIKEEHSKPPMPVLKPPKIKSKKFRKPKKIPQRKGKLVGIAPELMRDVKAKVKGIRDERDRLRKAFEDLDDKYEDAISRMGVVEGKCKAIEASFKNFKDYLMGDFMNEARALLKKEMSLQSNAISANNNRILRIEDDFIKISKEQDDSKFLGSFNDYYQSIKAKIFFITNCEPTDHRLITIALQTIRSIVDDMRVNGYWETGRDAIVTSLLNLKTYWRSKDQRIENLIGVEIDALENLR